MALRVSLCEQWKVVFKFALCEQWKTFLPYPSSVFCLFCLWSRLRVHSHTKIVAHVKDPVSTF